LSAVLARSLANILVMCNSNVDRIKAAGTVLGMVIQGIVAHLFMVMAQLGRVIAKRRSD
jgi:hypothetical protein